MGSPSSRSSTETSRYIWRRSKPTRAAWWSFVTRCEDIVASHAMPLNNRMQRTALHAERSNDAHDSRPSLLALANDVAFEKAANDGDVRGQVPCHLGDAVLRWSLGQRQRQYQLIAAMGIDEGIAGIEVSNHLIDGLIGDALRRLAARPQSKEQRRHRSRV